jgi:hypothetical protein
MYLKWRSATARALCSGRVHGSNFPRLEGLLSFTSALCRTSEYRASSGARRGIGVSIDQMRFGVVEVSVAMSPLVWLWMRFSPLTSKCTAPGTPLPRHLVHDVPHTAERQQRILTSPSPLLFQLIHLVHYQHVTSIPQSQHLVAGRQRTIPTLSS